MFDKLKGIKNIIAKKEVKKTEQEVLMDMEDLQRDMLKKFAVKCVEGSSVK